MLSSSLFFQLVARRYERGSLLFTTSQVVTQRGTVFGDEVLAAAIPDVTLVVTQRCADGALGWRSPAQAGTRCHEEHG